MRCKNERLCYPILSSVIVVVVVVFGTCCERLACPVIGVE